MWCACCDATGGWTRRNFLRVLGQAALATGVVPMAARAFTIFDEATDVAIGREVDPEILKQYGYYEKPELQNYVAEVGQRVVAVSGTRFQFQFKVVDSPVVNAFALPGGFVYITRGILALMNDEAQLAGVLGHESTHVNSRHGAKLMTKALGSQVATLAGVGAAAVVGHGSAVSAVAAISNHLTNYMLLGYGREYETEADEVGLRHARHAGYDPRRMVALFRDMRRQEIMTGQTLYHGFEATHPDTPIRIAKADTVAEMLLPEGGPVVVKTAEYRLQLDGLTYGEAKAQQWLRTYVVQPGDTLASIAAAELGDAGRRFEIASLNDLRDDAVVAPGLPLKLIVHSPHPPKPHELQLAPN